LLAVSREFSKLSFLSLFWVILLFSLPGFGQQYLFEKIGPEEGLPSARINALIQDERGLYWIATDGAGLVRFDGFEFDQVISQTQNMPPIARLLAEGPQQQIWFVNNQSLVRYNGLNFSSFPLPFNFVPQKLFFQDSSPVVTDGNSAFQLKGDTVVPYRVQYSHTEANVARSNDLRAQLAGDTLIIDYQGTTLRLTADNGLPMENYAGLMIDDQNVIWLYHDQGLVKLESLEACIYLLDAEVHSVVEFRGRTYLGTNLGLMRKSEDGSFLKKSIQPDFGVVLTLENFGGEIWLGTERGLYSFNGNTYKKREFGSGNSDFIFDLKSDGEVLWVGSGAGIVALNKDGRPLKPQANLPSSTVYDIELAPDGDLWFATFTQGFFRKTGDQWKQLTSYGGMPLDSLRFGSFTVDAESNLWLTTVNEGVFKVSEQKFTHFTPADFQYAEPRSIISSENSIYVGTNKGLFKIYANTVFKESLLDGLGARNYISQAFMLTGDTLFAGLQNGLLKYDLQNLDLSSPKLLLSDVELFFGEVSGFNDFSDSTLPFSGLPFEPRLPHNLNFLSFTLAGLSGKQPQVLRYRYRIKDGAEWTDAGTRREAVFARLNPGRYNFQAQVSRPGEAWSNTLINYPFSISAPIWQRWYFIAAIILIASTLVFLYFRERYVRASQRLKLQNSLMDMERKALRLQMNPHFIFNALDSISSFIFKNDPKQAVRYLNNFAKLMRLTLESSMEHLHPVETEVSILKNYLELEKLRFNDKFDYEIELDEEIDYNIGIPPMLIQPHVENAILHGIKPKKEGSFLKISFDLDGDILICTIQDDGIGREASKKLARKKDHRSMATEINRDRLKLLGEAMNEDATIAIEDLKNPTGTRVILRLPAKSI